MSYSSSYYGGSSYYNSNQPYEKINSNQPIQVVEVSKDMKRHSAAEGAMWGGISSAMTAGAYSAGMSALRSQRVRSALKDASPGLHDGLEKFDKFATNLENNFKKNPDIKQPRTVGKTLGGMATKAVFGKGIGAGIGRMALAAVPGAITGAMHNTTNGIISPY